jgi:multisubunit Na+/H+ antiporter MnhE subunit
MDRWARRALEALFWWGAALGIWLLSLSAVPTSELVVATLASLPCGIVAVAGRLATQHAWTMRPGWLVPVLLLPVSIVTDTCEVLLSAVTRRPGRFETVSVGGGLGTGALPEGRRAAATFWVTVTPGSYIIDIDPDSGQALLHAVSTHGPPMERLATR